MTGIRFPPAGAGSIVARRWRTELVLLPAHKLPRPSPRAARLHLLPCLDR